MSDLEDPADRLASDHPRLSDDDELDPTGDGITETPFQPAFEASALREELARGLEDLLPGAREWAHIDGSDEALAIAAALAEIAERLGDPVDSSDTGYAET